MVDYKAQYKADIEATYPIYQITCADYMYEFTEKRKNGKDPSASVEDAKKLQDCIMLSLEKVKDTPCEEVREAYKLCLAKHDRIKTPCRHLRLMLEECTAKHVGRLD